MDVRVQILIWFQICLLFAKPHFQTFNAVECIEKHIFSGISDYFRLILTDALTPHAFLDDFDLLSKLPHSLELLTIN